MVNQFVLLTLFVLIFSQQSVRVGGFTTITNISDQGLQVVNDYLKTKHPQLNNTTIIRAERQIVAGLNYRIWYAFGSGGEYFSQINVPLNGNVREVSFIVNKMQYPKSNISNIISQEVINKNTETILSLPVPISLESVKQIQTQVKLPLLPNLPQTSVLTNPVLLPPTLKIEEISSNINLVNINNIQTQFNPLKQRLTVTLNNLIDTSQLLQKPTPFVVFSNTLQNQQTNNVHNMLSVSKPIQNIQNTQTQIIDPQSIKLISFNNKVLNRTANKSQNQLSNTFLSNNILFQPTPFMYSQSSHQNELLPQVINNQQQILLNGCQKIDRNKNACTLCKKGYLLGTKGKCGIIDIICLVYNKQDYTCKQCIRGYTYNGNKCNKQLI